MNMCDSVHHEHVCDSVTTIMNMYDSVTSIMCDNVTSIMNMCDSVTSTMKV